MKNSDAILKNILNGLDTMIFVTVPDTCEILFMNESMKRHYGIEEDCVGQICYKILKEGRSKRCDSCPYFQLEKEPEKAVVWVERNNLTNRTYRNIDRYIGWPNGKTVHLQHSIDITDIKTATEALDKQLEQRSLMTLISQSFLSGENICALISSALRIIGESMGIAQILLLVRDGGGNTFICQNEWMAPKFGLPTCIGRVFNISEPLLRLLNALKDDDVFYLTSNDLDAKKAMEPHRLNFNNFLTASIFIGGELYAVLDYSREEGEQWSKADIDMARFVSNTLTSAFYRHSVECQLTAAKELAEQNNRSKSIFLAHMSHEIRTPLNTILGIAEIQLQSEAASPEIEEAFAQIYDSGALLLNIINDILDFSRIEAGQLEISPSNYDMPTLIYYTAQFNHMLYESKPIKLIIKVDEKAPLDLYGDELRIKQILNNLLSNAFKYTDEGEIELSVTAEFGQDKDAPDEVTLVFRVSDTGQGMTAEQISRLFDEYTRFNMQTNRLIAGVGLGMSITKRLLDMMQGEIFVESEPEKGSVFTVRLPQKRIGTDVCGAELGQEFENFRHRSLKKIKNRLILREYMPYGSVLVVDDVRANLCVAQGMLTPYGLRVETVMSGSEAIEKIKGGNVYDIIFMDHMMPKMDGMEATKTIRAMGYTEPIVALTANVVIGQSEKFLANGFDRFLSKPIDSRDLNALLNELIRDKQPAEIIQATHRENIGKIAPQEKPAIDLEIETAFFSDSENTVAVLEKIYADLIAGDENEMRLYATTVHGIKNALALINETALSGLARRLEQAGHERDIAAITDETPMLLDALRSLSGKIKRTETGGALKISEGDIIFLREKMLLIKAESSAYEKKAVKAALNELKQKKWPRWIADELEAISGHLLHGEYKKVAIAAENIVAELDQSPGSP
ncbi:MAG: ATP-binding protein [Deltaproteobacteria bacterium]|nr:ATP-binding protein [Deltaproteobacteria bacterium]